LTVGLTKSQCKMRHSTIRKKLVHKPSLVHNTHKHTLKFIHIFISLLKPECVIHKQQKLGGLHNMLFKVPAITNQKNVQT